MALECEEVVEISIGVQRSGELGKYLKGKVPEMERKRPEWFIL